MEGKANFRGAYRLSGTGIAVCLEIIDVGVIWNSLMAWPDWPGPPYFTTDLCNWSILGSKDPGPYSVLLLGSSTIGPSNNPVVRTEKNDRKPTSNG